MRLGAMQDFDPAFYLHGFQHRVHRRRLTRRMLASDDAGASYVGLHRASLALAAVRPASEPTPHVNLVLLDLRPEMVFAGLNTAVLAARTLCRERQMPLRVVILNVRPARRTVDAIARILAERCPELGTIEIVYQVEFERTRFVELDIWMPTFWVTAHALDVAARLGIVDPARVLYLIQDYEPSFFAFSADAALARSTYHAGFVPVVNSTPLADYLAGAEHLTVPRTQVFAPQLDLARLQAAASSRRASPDVRILFYGRPSKPRNLFSIGVTALRLARRVLDTERVPHVVASAGEAHSVVPLGGGRVLRPLGRLSWAGYFTELGRADVILSLQATPHPSHPPLDAVVSGATGVTNEIDGGRDRLHERLLARDPAPETLAEGVVDAVRSAREHGPAGYAPDFLASLGVGLEDAVSDAARALA